MVKGIVVACLAAVLWLIRSVTSEDASPQYAPEARTTVPVTAYTGPTSTGMTTPSSTGMTTAAPGPVREYRGPSWGEPVAASGTLVGSYEGDGFTVDAYRVAQVTVKGAAPRSDPASIVNFDSEDDDLEAGDVVDVYQCVFTNTGTAPLPMHLATAEAVFHYDDQRPLSYLSNYPLERTYRLVSDETKILSEESPELARGESVSIGGLAPHRPGETLTITVAVSPGDGDGWRGSPDDIRYGALHIRIE